MDLNRPRVSAVMPVKDRFDMALTALQRIVEQSQPPQEIVIVDDGSSVPFESRVGPIQGAALQRGIALKIVRHEHSQGVSAARNAGFSASTCGLVCFCDSDDYWSSDKLATIGAAFDANPALDVLFHAFRWNDARLPVFRWLPRERLVVLPRWLMVSFSFLNPSCLCISRAAYGSGFREDMSHYEDQEFFLRLSLTRKIWFLNRALTEMGRPPGSEGGASHNTGSMRRGALLALAPHAGPTPVGMLAYLKLGYHRARMTLDTMRTRSTGNPR